MGIISSKTDITDCYNLIEEDKINVNFIQLQKKPNCTITLEQLNVLLGLNMPKYSILENTNYPYLFCVDSIFNINEIVAEYGYEIGFSTKQKVLKNDFNSYNRAICTYSNYEYYKLVHV